MFWITQNYWFKMRHLCHHFSQYMAGCVQSQSIFQCQSYYIREINRSANVKFNCLERVHWRYQICASTPRELPHWNMTLKSIWHRFYAIIPLIIWCHIWSEITPCIKIDEPLGLQILVALWNDVHNNAYILKKSRLCHLMTKSWFFLCQKWDFKEI